MTLRELLSDSVDELDEHLTYDEEELAAAIERDEPHDIIHEVADGQVPIYTYDLMTLAADHIELAVTEPELGPAFDGSPTPVNIIAANVYERITEALWERWQDHYRPLQDRLEEWRDGAPQDRADLLTHSGQFRNGEPTVRSLFRVRDDEPPALAILETCT